jgi:hypothetical protein
MALLVVLFIVAAVVSVSMGILYRSDLAAAGAHNYALRTQADYIAWGGLEHVRALILANPDDPNENAAFSLGDETPFFYILKPSPGEPDKADPNRWQYDVACEVYYNNSPSTQPYSKLTATVLYDPNILDPHAWFTHIRR